jgi:hypothetical protein
VINDGYQLAANLSRRTKVTHQLAVSGNLRHSGVLVKYRSILISLVDPIGGTHAPRAKSEPQGASGSAR